MAVDEDVPMSNCHYSFLTRMFQPFMKHSLHTDVDEPKRCKNCGLAKSTVQMASGVKAKCVCTDRNKMGPRFSVKQMGNLLSHSTSSSTAHIDSHNPIIVTQERLSGVCAAHNHLFISFYLLT